jgi:hypothetical protein
MVLSEPEMKEVLVQDRSWLVFLEDGETARAIGNRSLPAAS